MKNVYKFLAFLLAVTMLLAFTGIPAKCTEGDITFVGCTVRNTGVGWSVLDNSEHEPVGITGTGQTATHVTVYYATMSQVVSFNVTVDETMASAGYTVGALGSHTYIFMMKTMSA
jgi:hypothetical protein